MKTDFTGRHFLKLLDFTPEEIEELIDLAADLKKKKKAGELVEMCIRDRYNLCPLTGRH